MNEWGLRCDPVVPSMTFHDWVVSMQGSEGARQHINSVPRQSKRKILVVYGFMPG